MCKNNDQTYALVCLFGLIFYVPINSVSVLLALLFLGLTNSKEEIKYIAQEHNTVSLVKLDPATPRFSEPTHIL